MNEINFFVLSNIDFLKTIPRFPFQMDDGVCIFELDSSLMCMMSLVAKGKCYKLTMFFFLFSWFVMYKHVVSMDHSSTLWISSHSCCACFMPRIPHSERVSFAHVLDLWCQSWLLEFWGFPTLFVVICYHRQVSAHCVICSKNMQHLKALRGHFRDLTDSSVVSCPDRHPQRWCEQFSCFLFDSSRGFPGEGPTWTCRSANVDSINSHPDIFLWEADVILAQETRITSSNLQNLQMMQSNMVNKSTRVKCF